MRRASDDRLFRIATGAFPAIVLLIVGGIAVELARESSLSITKFGLAFWKGRVWDPVSGEFVGHAVLGVSRADRFHADRAGHRDLHL